MKESGQTVIERLRSLVARLHRPDPLGRYAGEEPPLRSALFNADQMEQHGRHLALAHRVAPGRTRDRLLTRLAENEDVLAEVCGLLTEAVTSNRRITPAADWLLDNFYLIEEQIRTAKRHLPKGYSRELPRLARGPSAGLPRVYDLAFEAISHGDGWVDAESLSRFVATYQTVAPLTVGELWAIPIMLRLALIENLRRVGVRIAAGTTDRNRADAWADEMLDVAEHDPKSLILVIADMARSNPPMVSSFVAELARRLQGQSIRARVAAHVDRAAAERVRRHDRAAGSVGDPGTGRRPGLDQQHHRQPSIPGGDEMARVRRNDERRWSRSCARIRRGLYGEMDFATRDRYRHVIEEIARASSLAEVEVARKAVQLAHDDAAGVAGRNGDDARESHVGFYLVDKGRALLERAAHVRPGAMQWLRSLWRRSPLPLYVGAIVAITAALTTILLEKAHRDGVVDEKLIALGVLLLLATSQLAVGMVNWLATLLVTPHALPRMDFSRGIAPRSRTLVVVPTLLVSPEGIESLVEALEVRYLANRDDHLHFGLLTDFPDAAEEAVPGDQGLLDLARERIEGLNEKHGRAQTFFLLHRPRRWNAQERVWMGHERKRGKLADLNRLSARKRSGSLLARRRRDRGIAGREVRDHARHRYRSCRATRPGSSSA